MALRSECLRNTRYFLPLLTVASSAALCLSAFGQRTIHVTPPASQKTPSPEHTATRAPVSNPSAQSPRIRQTGPASGAVRPGAPAKGNTSLQRFYNSHESGLHPAQTGTATLYPYAYYYDPLYYGFGSLYGGFIPAYHGSIYPTPGYYVPSYSTNYPSGYSAVFDYPSPYAYSPTLPDTEDYPKGWRSMEDSSQNQQTPFDRVSKPDAAAKRAAEDIRQAYLRGDADLLAKHVRRDIQVHIIDGGVRQQAIDAGAFLDRVQKDIAVKTDHFTIDGIRQRANDLVVVTAHRSFHDGEGMEQAVTLRFYLQKMEKDYIILQVETVN